MFMKYIQQEINGQRQQNGRAFVFHGQLRVCNISSQRGLKLLKLSMQTPGQTFV